MMRGTRGRAGVLAALCWVGLAWGPSVAQACAVCTAGRDEENALAFLLSTIGMSLMPLVALGTLVFVLWRRIQKLEVEGRAGEPAEAPVESSHASSHASSQASLRS